MVCSSSLRKVVCFSLIVPWALSGSTHAAANKVCATWEKELQHEHRIITKREKDLSLKIQQAQQRHAQGAFDQIIRMHHASIDLHNQKLKTFKKSCVNQTQSSPEAGKPNSDYETEARPHGLNSYADHYIQLGAFKDKSNAMGLQERLKRMGLNSQVSKKGKAYFVWAGPYLNAEKARAVKDFLRTKHNIGPDSFIIRMIKS